MRFGRVVERFARGHKIRSCCGRNRDKPIAWVAYLKNGLAYRYYYDPDLEGTALGDTIYALNDLGAPPVGGLLRGELFNSTVRPECVGKELIG